MQRQPVRRGSNVHSGSNEVQLSIRWFQQKERVKNTSVNAYASLNDSLWRSVAIGRTVFKNIFMCRQILLKVAISWFSSPSSFSMSLATHHHGGARVVARGSCPHALALLSLLPPNKNIVKVMCPSFLPVLTSSIPVSSVRQSVCVQLTACERERITVILQ